MLEVIEMLSQAHAGVFTRGDALAAGLDDRTLQRLQRERLLHRVRHGSYVPAEVWGNAGPSGRHLLVARAVSRSLEDRAALSHTTAALALGLPVWGADLSRVHVTRLDDGAGRVERDLVHHVGQLPLHDVHPYDGMLVTGTARTVLEHARVSSLQSGLVTADAALHRRDVSTEELEELQRSLRSWPRGRKVDLVVRMADGGSESVGESRARYLFWRHGIPRPVLQHEVRDRHGGLVAVTDFGWLDDGVLGEFDGRVKYGRLLPPGESPGDAVFREKVREDMIRELTGFRVVRLTWGDLNDAATTAARVKRQLRSAA